MLLLECSMGLTAVPAITDSGVGVFELLFKMFSCGNVTVWD